MNKSLVIILILTLLLGLSESIDKNEQIDDLDLSHCSQLIGKVNKEVIDEALAFLPPKNNADILEMLIQMTKAKEEYSLNEVNSAYLAYKWIGQNIQIEGLEGNEDPTKVYNEGKGNPVGFSSLFNRICTYLKIESNSISGYGKILSRDGLPDYISYNWNYIVINSSYYLVDVAMSSILKFDEPLFNFYFGTYPEIFIRYNFPKESKWQLLSDPYTFEKFNSVARLIGSFYIYGFKTISPDLKEISGGTQKFLLTYDASFPIENITYTLQDSNYNKIETKGLNFDKGKAELNIDLSNEKSDFLSLEVYPKNGIHYSMKIAEYRINHSKKIFNLRKDKGFINI